MSPDDIYSIKNTVRKEIVRRYSGPSWRAYSAKDRIKGLPTGVMSCWNPPIAQIVSTNRETARVVFQKAHLGGNLEFELRRGPSGWSIVAERYE